MPACALAALLLSSVSAYVPARCGPPRLCAAPVTPAVGVAVDSDEKGVVAPVNGGSFLTANGEEYKKAVYTKEEGDAPPKEVEAPLPIAALSYAASDVDSSVELRRVLDATLAMVNNPDPDGQEAYGDWCRDAEREALIEALRSRVSCGEVLQPAELAVLQACHLHSSLIFSPLPNTPPRQAPALCVPSLSLISAVPPRVLRAGSARARSV